MSTTTPKPDPATKTAAHIVDSACDFHWETESDREHLICELAGVIRIIYAPHMKAAEEMAKVINDLRETSQWREAKWDNNYWGEIDGRSESVLARWRELNPEVEG